MKKFAAFLVKHRLVILGVILLLAVASTFAMFYVNVNSDILSYLPEGMDMTEGLDFMQETFGMQGDAIVGIRGDGLTYDRMKEFADDFASRPGLKAVIWYGTIAEMANADISIPSIAQGLLDQYGITEESLAEILQQIATNPEVEDMFCPEENTYLLMLQLSVPSSSDEAMDLLEYIETSVQDAGFDVALGGSSQVTREVFMSTIGEIGKYIVVAVLVMFVILLLTSTSLVEPIIFMVTLGVSILINMGTNIILPSVSVVTFAASSVLQLALSMDYAIFLMHQYEAEKRTALDNRLAMERAIPKTFSTIAASALTTVGGFLALFFMKFEIGADLGIVLAKGVALSLLTVIFLQPSLMLILDKAREKTTHRLFLPTFKKSSGFAVTYRKTIVAIALLLLIPVAVLQGRVDLSYIKFTDEDPNPSEVEQVVDTMSNSVIVIVPVEKDEETGRTLEPMELAIIEVPEEYVGAVMQKIGARRGELENMGTREGGSTHLEFKIPARGLIGYRSEFMTDTNGNGIMNNVFDSYEPYKGDIQTRERGSIIAHETGETSAYGLFNTQDRGRLFVGPGVPVYEGMIVGENNHENDLAVNVTKGKQLTNTRSANKDHTVVLKKPREMSLEVCLDYINEDELVEVTPVTYRLRKKILNTNERKKYENKKNPK